MEDYFQFSVLDEEKQPFKIDRKVRLIELFAGYGSQHIAFEELGVDFESYRICEWAVKSIQAYKDLHFGNDNTDYSQGMSKEEIVDYLFDKGISADYNKPMTREQINRMGEQKCRTVYNNIKATHNLVSVTNITAEDLNIVDTDKYTYFLTYSFPCQDLSLAGKQKLMAKGSGTRSSLLWEVERLLNECSELPQVLLMENVPQVHGKKNKEHFDKWIKFLESKGYSNYWKDLNAKNFGIPQNRNRTFMVSVLGNYTYEFPKEFPLELRLKDMLEDSVDEKYYISNERVDKIVNSAFAQEKTRIQTNDVCSTLLARDYKDPKCIEVEPIRIGNIYGEQFGTGYAGNVWNKETISPTLMTMQGGNRQPLVVDEPRVCEERKDEGLRFFKGDYVGALRTIDACGDKRVVEPTIQKVDIPQTVRVRKYPIDTDKLVQVLREHKNLSNQEIAQTLNAPLTKVEHWFRKDEYFAIPDAEICSALKALLKIETDEFDDAITTFEEKEGVFEKANRCYFTNGIAPTLTSTSGNEKVIETKVNVIGNYSPSNHDASRIVDANGLAPTVKENHGTVTAITERFFKQALETLEENDCSVGDTVDAFNKRVNTSGVSPTITTRPEGFKTAILPVVEPLAYDEQNGYIRKDGVVGTLTTDGSSPKHNNRVIENCYVSEKEVLYAQGVCRTLLTQSNNLATKVKEPCSLRIRKLTPREYWRLQGVKDEYFDRVAPNQSNSSLYHLAGDSICVPVLYYIFKQMYE